MLNKLKIEFIVRFPTISKYFILLVYKIRFGGKLGE